MSEFAVKNDYPPERWAHDAHVAIWSAMETNPLSAYDFRVLQEAILILKEAAGEDL